MYTNEEDQLKMIFNKVRFKLEDFIIIQIIDVQIWRMLRISSDEQI